MASSKTPEVPTQVEPKVFPISLDEFCSRLSATDKRVELIGGFHHDQRSVGNLTATEAEFLELFTQFAQRPVKE